MSAFLHTLRDNDFAVGLQEGQDAAMLIAGGYAARPALLRSAFRHLLTSRKAEWNRFDGLFDAFWLGHRVRSRSVTTGAAKAANSPSLKSLQDRPSDQPGGNRPPDQIPSGDDDAAQRSGEGRMEGASLADNLAETDFRHMAQPELIAQAHEAAARLARAMRTRLTRRDLARRRGYRLDIRRTIHANIGHGGVPIRLVRRKHKDRPLRLVVLLDASGSMSMYTGFFIRFVHGVLDEFREAEAFLFHTRLAPISDANRAYAARAIHSRTCVMIVSDGYETGDAMLLGREMKALAKRCRRIAWLNPMMGWEGYAPEAAGIKAALPHVDLYARANTLRSLVALEPYLAAL